MLAQARSNNAQCRSRNIRCPLGTLLDPYLVCRTRNMSVYPPLCTHEPAGRLVRYRYSSIVGNAYVRSNRWIMYTSVCHRQMCRRVFAIRLPQDSHTEIGDDNDIM